MEKILITGDGFTQRILKPDYFPLEIMKSLNLIDNLQRNN